MVADQAVTPWVNIGSLGATWNVTQGTAAAKPTFRLIGSAGKMGNAPAVQFDGGDWLFTGVIAAQAQPVTVMAITRVTGSGAELFMGGEAPNRIWFYSNTRVLTTYAGAFGAGQTLTAGAIQCSTTLVSGASSIGSMDGVPGSSYDASTNTFDNVVIGASGSGGGSFLTGLIYQLAVWGGAGQPSQASLYAYSASNFGATPQ